MASRKNGVLYVGLTNNLKRRVFEHKKDLLGGFTKRYKIYRLVYFEYHRDVHHAILREKRIKKWKRQWKIELIESSNPQWEVLYDKL
jgi:putative endonuclease